MLRNIMSRDNVTPEFLSAVRSFHDKTSNIEEAFGGASWKICAQSLRAMLAWCIYSSLVTDEKG